MTEEVATMKYVLRLAFVAFLMSFAGLNAQTMALPDIANTRIHSPALVSSGQPDRTQFGAIANSGVGVVINLAPRGSPDSIGDEGELARATGMDYVFIPVDWGRPSQEDLDQFLATMDECRAKKVLGQCTGLCVRVSVPRAW
ncbi:MAG: protein tyrosine phosphatase (PTP) superfamily phosphohydrolase (DUF442 family) [Gammaproteobacteria bacterium]|jgi:protein tyrosine phosphatase (PTP) superfamily phosphohydrolase (DUF442 family)